MSKETDSEIEPQQLQFKIILLGDGSVGKTSVANRFTDDTFSNMYKQTIGLDFFLKRLELPGDKQVTLQIWDIGGQSIGGKMLQKYIYGAQAILLVYDITNYESFQNLEDWYRLVQQTFVDESLPYVGLVGNKTDLNHMQVVKMVQHNQFVSENNMKSYFLSAKTGEHISTTLRQIAADLAGVELTKMELENEVAVLKAQIINHEQNDPDVKSLKRQRRKGDLESKCLVQ